MHKWYLLCLMLFSLSKAYGLSGTQLDNWREDILYLQEQVKTHHLNAFHSQPEPDFDNHVNAILAHLPKLSEVEVESQLMKLMASIKDGHSNYYPMSGPHQHFPFLFLYLDGALKIVGATSEYEALIGQEVIAIDGRTIPDVFEQLQPYLYGVDNRYSAQDRFAFQVTLAKVLFAVGITKSPTKAMFTFNVNGKSQSQTVDVLDMKAFNQIQTVLPKQQERATANDIGMPGIQMRYFDATKTAYFDFDTYPTFDEVIGSCTTLIKQLTKRQTRHLIIDLRDNGGGSFYTGLAFSSCLSHLDTVNWQRGVVVLINGGTFSAAMSNAAQYHQILNATLIGSPTGGDPNHYGELLMFTLPHSERRFSVSERYYAFVETPTDALYPAISVSPSWQDILDDRDVVLNKALEYLNVTPSN
ncbi:S41 family peptidase (plasmid) [Pseudoalteromonas xiamenensis]|uniref:S41 family peptidase n=1 Tax=Pseudoalteromonas xiamenensis TaxID=882626 RepID=UPI0027E50F21|nr:S41 family peptidase [Pseudoalteromonas xiamenensis]WMN62045.1 S41 family peptidase [Pseudoalteromonas xiamenensis]